MPSSPEQQTLIGIHNTPGTLERRYVPTEEGAQLMRLYGYAFPELHSNDRLILSSIEPVIKADFPKLPPDSWAMRIERENQVAGGIETFFVTRGSDEVTAEVWIPKAGIDATQLLPLLRGLSSGDESARSQLLAISRVYEVEY